MQFDEIGKSDAKTLLLLPGTACTYQINFSRVIDLLAERYHLICVNYDGFEGDSSKPFTEFLDAFADSLNKLHPQTIQREFYSDYITPLENDIHVDGTTVHIIYALKMGKKYEKRYLKHFHHPDILRYDMQHEAWLFEQSWTMPVLNDIDACMAK